MEESQGSGSKCVMKIILKTFLKIVPFHNPLEFFYGVFGGLCFFLGGYIMPLGAEHLISGHVTKSKPIEYKSGKIS